MSTKRETEEAKATCHRLWHSIAACEWTKARDLLADDFEATWPQTREQINGADHFIELACRRYPHEDRIQVFDILAEYDQWDKEHKVAIQVCIESKMPEGNVKKCFAISVFLIDREGLVKSAVEYWCDTYEPPEWRKALVQRYQENDSQ